jgi:hypothetical protein
VEREILDKANKISCLDPGPIQGVKIVVSMVYNSQQLCIYFCQLALFFCYYCISALLIIVYIAHFPWYCYPLLIGIVIYCCIVVVVIVDITLL